MALDRSLQILLVDDNHINQKVAAHLLQKQGHTVHLADNGREALDLLDRTAVDLVLMDVQMPEMDGLEATARIRAREQGTDRHLPIVALTAQALPEDRDMCLQAGMDVYLTKPIQAQPLLLAVEEALNRALIPMPALPPPGFGPAVADG
jgi:CheY-like chemotaxis protein